MCVNESCKKYQSDTRSYSADAFVLPRRCDKRAHTHTYTQPTSKTHIHYTHTYITYLICIKYNAVAILKFAKVSTEKKNR